MDCGSDRGIRINTGDSISRFVVDSPRGSHGEPIFLSHSLKIARNLLDDFGSQANEGMWGMPGHTEAMKAAVSCDKPGGAAHTL